MLDTEVRKALDGTPVAHLSTILPDGAPHAVPVWVGTEHENIVIAMGPRSRKARNLRRDPRLSLSLTAVGDPMRPILISGRVVTWLDGSAAVEIVDKISLKYVGISFPSTAERVVAVVEPLRQIVGVSWRRQKSR